MMIDFNGMFQQIRTVSHFRSLPDESLREIVNSGKVQRYATGQVVFLQEDPCAGMFVLIKGRVNLCKLGPQGQQNILATVHPVIMFNEVAVLDGGANPVTAIATQDSVLWCISCEKFQSLLNRYPEIGLGLLHVLAARNRRLIQHYEDLSYRSVYARIAKLLLDLSEDGAKTINRREYSIEQLAALAATVPEAISRSLKGYKDKGLITSTRTAITITDADGLARSAQLKFDFLEPD